MENCERSLISWVSQMKSAEEVRQVEPGRRKRDLMEPGNSGWFTESFVNICKFGLSFRFIEEPGSLKLHLIVLWAAVYSLTRYGEACSATCNSFSNMTEKLFSLLPFPFNTLFLLCLMEGGLSLSCTILMLSWETGFKKAISLPLSLFLADVSVSAQPVPSSLHLQRCRERKSIRCS